MALLRSLAEAGAGKARLADWYWWVSILFGNQLSIHELADRYGEAGESLASMIRTPPEPRAVPTGRSRPIDRASKKPTGSPPPLSRVALAGRDGIVSFRAQIDEKGYFQAPRPNPMAPNVNRPISLYAALEEFRDQRLAFPKGPVHTISRRMRQD